MTKGRAEIVRYSDCFKRAIIEEIEKKGLSIEACRQRRFLTLLTCTSPVPSLMLRVLLVEARRGVSLYSARQIASKIVDLPAPVAPVIAKSPTDFSVSASKSIVKGLSIEAIL